MKSALMIFPYYVRTGGWIALAGKRFLSSPKEKTKPTARFTCSPGTHFHFIREIPILARYEVRSQIVGWDHKWVRHVLVLSFYQPSQTLFVLFSPVH
jgi:hypothetical protein